MAEPDKSLAFTLPYKLTKTIHRQPYDYISTERQQNLQTGKIILITGGGSGIGAVCPVSMIPFSDI